MRSDLQQLTATKRTPVTTNPQELPANSRVQQGLLMNLLFSIRGCGGGFGHATDCCDGYREIKTASRPKWLRTKTVTYQNGRPPGFLKEAS